jgi:signal transduction histidine kinase
LLSEIAQTFQFISNEKEVNLIVDLKGSQEKLMGEQRRIRQLVFNLLGNAFKFTKEGFVKMSLQVNEIDSVNNSIRVQDTGIGIHESKLDVIFNRFTQANREIYKDFGGIGLGLFISKVLVVQMKGTLSVHSKIGEGTVFDIKLTLPVVRQIQE